MIKQKFKHFSIKNNENCLKRIQGSVWTLQTWNILGELLNTTCSLSENINNSYLIWGRCMSIWTFLANLHKPKKRTWAWGKYTIVLYSWKEIIKLSIDMLSINPRSKLGEFIENISNAILHIILVNAQQVISILMVSCAISDKHIYVWIFKHPGALRAFWGERVKKMTWGKVIFVDLLRTCPLAFYLFLARNTMLNSSWGFWCIVPPWDCADKCFDLPQQCPDGCLGGQTSSK